MLRVQLDGVGLSRAPHVATRAEEGLGDDPGGAPSRAVEVGRPYWAQYAPTLVVSTLTHGYEAWKLTPGIMAMLNGWNARCVSVITGRGIAEEAGRSQTFDLISHLRVRRLRWVGHVLRMDDSRFPKQALKALHEKWRSGQIHSHGTLLMDVPLPKQRPQRSCFADLVALAGEHGAHTECQVGLPSSAA